MADNSFRIKSGSLNLKPLATPPDNPVIGDVYIDNTGTMKIYDGGSFNDVGGGGFSGKLINFGNISRSSTGASFDSTLDVDTGSWQNISSFGNIAHAQSLLVTQGGSVNQFKIYLGASSPSVQIPIQFYLFVNYASELDPPPDIGSLGTPLASFTTNVDGSPFAFTSLANGREYTVSFSPVSFSASDVLHFVLYSPSPSNTAVLFPQPDIPADVTNTSAFYRFATSSNNWGGLNGGSPFMFSLSDSNSGVVFSFDSPFYIQVNGLQDSVNTIPISQSPIVISADGDVAYVVPNQTAPGGNLTTSVVNGMQSVPTNGFVIARNVGGNLICDQTILTNQNPSKAFLK